MGCHALLQGIFPTQGPSAGLLHWEVGSLPLVPPGRLPSHSWGTSQSAAGWSCRPLPAGHAGPSGSKPALPGSPEWPSGIGVHRAAGMSEPQPLCLELAIRLPAGPTGAASARPLSPLPCRSPCRATPAAPGRSLLPPSPHQLLAAAQSLPHPLLSLTPSALRVEPRPFPALKGLQAATLPSLCASNWHRVPAPSAVPLLLRYLKCPFLTALPGLLLPPGVLTSSV